jgi:hypothetical protein
VIGKVVPLIDGKSRREAIRSLRGAGYSATAELLASLPGSPDREAMEYFNTEGQRA